VQHHLLTADEWDALAADPEFQSLISARRRFVIPATIFFLIYYLALPVSVAVVPDVMTRPAWGPLTVAWVFALSQFVVAWLLLALYLAYEKHVDEMADRVVERARQRFPA
jgi:uncharacterized membrane protein (DUF485 family)